MNLSIYCDTIIGKSIQYNTRHDTIESLLFKTKWEILKIEIH